MNPTGHAHAQCFASQSFVVTFFFEWHLSTALLTTNPLSKRKKVECFNDMDTAIH